MTEEMNSSIEEGAIDEAQTEAETKSEEIARAKEVDLLAENGTLLMHQTNALSVPTILNEGILSLADQERRDKGKPVKRLLPGGYNPVLQQLNYRGTEYVSHFDQKDVNPEIWQGTLLRTVGVSMIINPTTWHAPANKVFEEYKGWPGESVTRSVAPNDIIGIVADPAVAGDMTIEDLVSYYIGYRDPNIDSRFQGMKGIDSLVWALRAIMIENSKIASEDQTISNLDQHTIMKKTRDASAEGYVYTREPELEKMLPLLKRIRHDAHNTTCDALSIKACAEDRGMDEDEYYEQQKRRTDDMAEYSPVQTYEKTRSALTRESAKVLKLYLADYFGQDISKLTTKDILILLGKKNQIPVYRINKERSGYDLLWPPEEKKDNVS